MHGVRILVGSTEMGQGSRTTLSQIVAETLGLPLARVEVAEPDTARVPDSGPTVASRTCMVVGGLLRSCAAEIKERLATLKDPHTVLPDEVVSGKGRTIALGGTTLELTYHGLNHSDSTLVMRLPKEKIVFVVDSLPVGQVPGRGMIDFHPVEAEDFIKQVLALDWERLIPGHPGPNDRLGTKKDVQDQLEFLQDASAEMKTLAQAGKCWEPAEKEFKLPKYESWPGYAAGLPFVARRYCGLWGRGT